MNPTVLLAEESSESTERRKETSLWYLAPRSWHANAMAGSWRTEGMAINSPWKEIKQLVTVRTEGGDNPN